jgi:ABC-type transporter MlaC component
MRKRDVALALVLITAALLIIPTPARADDTPRLTIERAIDQVVLIAKGGDKGAEWKNAEIKNLLEAKLDLPFIAKNALSGTWRSLTPAERAQFTALFAEFLEKKAVGSLISLIDVKHFQATYVSESVPFDQRLNLERAAPCVDVCEAKVYFQGKRGSANVPILLRKSTDGNWKIYDASPDGSFIDNFRSQYSHILKSKKFPELLQFIRDKIDGKILW